jgi:hypothetical protein
MKKVEKIKKGLPSGMVKVGEECERAVKRLIKKGQTKEQATNTVLKLLEDSTVFIYCN